MQFSGQDVQNVRNESNPTGGARRGERVVFALNQESKEQFLRPLDRFQLPAADYQWIDPSACNSDAWAKLLLDLEPTVLLTGWGSPAIPDSFLRSKDMPLRYVCHLAGSVRQVVPRDLIERGVLVSNWGTMVSGAVAEHAMLLVLGALRNLPAWASYMVEWPQRTTPSLHLPLETRTLRGKRVGLHGFGSIARELVRMLQPFGVHLTAHSQGVPEDFFAQHGVRCCRSLPELFSTSDVLIECEALTPATKGLVNEQILRCLPTGAVFVNVGRGHVVDEAALAQVARENQLRLGLDVFQQEPLSADSPLRTLPQALLSPHIAGPAQDGFTGLCEFALANLRRYLLGEQIEAQVSLEVYDRST